MASVIILLSEENSPLLPPLPPQLIKAVRVKKVTRKKIRKSNELPDLLMRNMYLSM
jgi:hypothetical protein